MIVSWNISVFNKAGKLWEISSHLLEHYEYIEILIEIRVKADHASSIRKN